MKTRVLLTAWGSFESGRVLWCTRQAWRVLWRHHVIEGSLNVIPWLVYASHPMSECFLIDLFHVACNIFGELLN